MDELDKVMARMVKEIWAELERIRIRRRENERFIEESNKWYRRIHGARRSGGKGA
jgi:hypothetical protein